MKLLTKQNLNELQQFRGPMGLAVERDLHYKKETIGEVKKRLFGF